MSGKIDTRTTCYVEEFDRHSLSITKINEQKYDIAYSYGRLRITFEKKEELIDFVKKLEEEMKDLGLIKNNDFDMLREKQDYIEEVKRVGGKVE